MRALLLSHWKPCIRHWNVLRCLHYLTAATLSGVSALAVMEVSTGILCIGTGQLASVYVLTGREAAALKAVSDPNRYAELLAEFERHKSVYDLSKGLTIKVPQPLEYYPSYSKFKEDLSLGVDLPGSADPAMYSMERVWPVPRKLSASIRSAYFPDEHKHSRIAFLCRVYLGQPPSQPDQPVQPFDPSNFPLTAQRCNELKMPASKLAADMGKMLARIHFCAGKVS